MKSRIIVLALFTLLTVGVISTPMRTGSAGPLAGPPSENIDSSSPRGVAPSEGSFCGTPTAGESISQKLAALPRAINPRAAAAPAQTGSVTIPVYFHVIRQGTSAANGNVPEHVLDNQINVLNSAFSGQAGGVNTSFRFTKAGVTRTTNSTWFRMGIKTQAERTAELQAKTALRMDAPYVLNFYTIGGEVTSPYAWATFPWTYGGDPVHDGIVVPFTMLPGGTAAPFNAGDIAVHEVGHWLGLRHTHQGGCAGSDEVSDTPQHAEQLPNDGIVGMCPAALDTCPGVSGADPIHNYMQSTSDACKYEFTQGQAARMDTMYNDYRQPAVSPTVSISSVQPSEYTGGSPYTLTVSGQAQNGFGGVQLVWRDTTVGGGENVVATQATPDPTTHTWTITIPSSNRCHNYSIYANYAGVRSQTYPYNGQISGYCNETTRVIWIQPYSTPGVGSPGSLIVAGSAENAPPGYQVKMWYRDVTAGTGWVLRPYAPLPDSNGIWLNEIPNANYFHVYQVQVTYDVVTSAVCSYAGQNSISWCQ
jgi:hypothetical protein